MVLFRVLFVFFGCGSWTTTEEEEEEEEEDDDDEEDDDEDDEEEAAPERNFRFNEDVTDSRSNLPVFVGVGMDAVKDHL